MIVEVELTHPLLNGVIRQVTITDEYWELKPLEKRLEIVYGAGQNEVDEQPLPSVCMNDVIRLNGKRYRIDLIGFTELRRI